MKKKSNIGLLGAFAISMLMFMACESDNNSNPTLNEPAAFVLNTPANAENNVYDLGSTKTLEITCSQPDYGFPAGTTYTVQVSLEDKFVEKTDAKEANYTPLVTLYTTAKIGILSSELNDAVTNLWGLKNKGQAFPSEPIAVYIRLKAMITGSDQRGVSVSNVIKLPKVLGDTSASLKIPNVIYLSGSMLTADKPMVKVSRLDGSFWAMVYFKAGDNFRFGVKEKEYINADYPALALKDKASSGVKKGANDPNGTQFQVANAGWYIVYVTSEVVSNQYAFTMTFYQAEVYLSGPTANNEWGFQPAWRFTTPTTTDGEFVSPAMAGAGEVRMSAKTDVEWWRTEFTLFKGKIYYREDNAINNSWAKDKGDDYSVQGSTGKFMHLDFTKGIGELK